MSNETTVPRYKTFDPDLLKNAEDLDAVRSGRSEEGGRADEAVRYLTWGILSVCLGLWAVVGFIFWLPLLLRSMIQFSLALSRSMLQGTEPAEAGRVLRDTVDFYRRGFTVAIDAVFGRAPTKREKHTPLGAKRLLFEIGWTVLFWYAALFLVGVIETSPIDMWNQVVALPWAEWGGSVADWFSGLLGGGAEGAGDAAVGAAPAAEAGTGGV